MSASPSVINRQPSLGAATTYGHPLPAFSQQTFLLGLPKGSRLARLGTLRHVRTHVLTAPVLGASGVDWSEVHAVRLLGVALGALILLWAIRRMFGGK